ncbi:MAG: hypothetical protein MZV64_44655 [Ignavibacteriales bacterium]|nr:hypothetical protein [Ignavibacteriales bacterium]
MLVFLIFVVAAAEIAIAIPIVLLLVRARAHARRRRLHGPEGLDAMDLLTLIVLLPLARLPAERPARAAATALGKRFVTVVGCGLPIARLRCSRSALLRQLQAGGGAPLRRDRLHLGADRRHAASRSPSTSTA